MSQQSPGWQPQFLERHQLPPGYLDSALKWFAPVVDLIAEHRSGAGRPLLVAVNGSQGSGKTTFCDYFCHALHHQWGLKAVALSLDDFYLTRAERQHLSQTVNPLLATRGAPGTHDLKLLSRTLDELMQGGGASIPRFDKSVDDRRSENDWDQVSEPIDVILLEGWCMGVTAQDEESLARSVNVFEQAEDGDGSWRAYVNRALADHFPGLYERVDEWIMLRAPSFDSVYRWRLEQEHKLAAMSEGEGVMSDEQVARFIQFYQRLTEQCLKSLPHRVNHLFSLDEQRRVVAYLAAPGNRF